MLATCENCHRTVTPLKQGFPELFTSQKFKCPNCHNPIKLKNFNWAIYIAVFSFIATILLMALSSAYSSTVTVSNTPIGQIRGDFYGVNIGSNINTSEYQNLFDDSGMGIFRLDSTIEYVYSNQTARTNGVNFTQWSINIAEKVQSIKYANSKGYKVLLIADFVPTWLADNSSGNCTNLRFCPPTNSTIWANIVVDYINRTTEGNATLQSSLIIEVFNEPDGSFLLGQLSVDQVSKFYNYSLMYNATYVAIKSAYPNMEVIGASLTYTTSNNMKKGFISNFSDYSDGIAYHTYQVPATFSNFYDAIQNQTSDIIDTYEMFSKVHKRIIVSEWNHNTDSVRGASENVSFYTMQLASGYIGGLNYLPNNLTMIFYNWRATTTYPMINATTGYARTPYNITKLFATNHKALNTVYNSSSTNESLKVVVSKDTSKTYITLTNTLSEAVNVTLNVNLQNTYLRDVETNTSYPVINGKVNIQNLAGYGVLTMDSNPIVATVDFASLIGVVRSDFYGTNVQNGNLLVGSANASWYKSQLLDAGITFIRYDTALAYFYGGPYNFGFEEFYNITDHVVSGSGNSGTRGWGVGTNSNINVSVGASTESHSGTYSLNITHLNGSQVGYAYFRPMYFTTGNIYNASIWLKGSGSVVWKIVNYSGTVCDTKTITLTADFVQHSVNCTGNSADGQIQMTLDGVGVGEWVLMDDWYITENGTDFFWRLSNINEYIIMNKWAYDNNISIMPIIAYTPAFLSDVDNGCSLNATTGNIIGTCATDRADLFGNMAVDYINWVSNGSTSLRDSLKVEIWNEPTAQFFMSSLGVDHENKSFEYNRIYNASYTKLKLAYPNMQVGGPSYAIEGDTMNSSSPMLNGFLNNFSNRFHFFTVHDYVNVNVSPKEHYDNQTNLFFTLCNTYGANCSHMIWGEWNIVDSSITANSSRVTEYNSLLGSSYAGFLNSQYISNLSVMIFKFSEDGSDYRYSMIYNFTHKPPYNITKLFAHYAPAQSNIYNVTISLGTIKAVVSKKSGACNAIFTNTNTTDVEVGLNASTAQCGNIWMRVENGSLYNASSGLASFGNLSGYAVQAFTTPNLTLSSAGLNKTNYLGEQIGSLGSEIYYSSTTRDEIHIASTLPTYNVTVIANANCELVSKAVYTSKSRSFSKTYEGSSLNCVDGKLYLGEVVIDPSNESNTIRLYPSAEIQQICEESEQQMQDAVKIVGMLLSILLIGSVIGIIFAYVQGYIDLDVNIKNIRFEQVVGGILIISFTFLLIVTIVYITSSYCPALT